MASRSGYGASLTVGSYTGAELTDVRARISHAPVEVSDLASTWVERQAGLIDWEVTGTKNYASEAFLTLADAARTSVVCKITDMKSTVIFSGVGFITNGGTNLPMGAATEEITVVGNGTAPSKP
jgi:hypothetical protein